jgi:hypothetical protein
MRAKHNHTFFCVRSGDHYMSFTKVPLGQSCILVRFPHLGPLLHQTDPRYSHTHPRYSRTRHIPKVLMFCWVLMFSFDSLTCIAKRYVLYNFTFHSIPPVGNTEILIHLIASEVNRISRIMSFPKYEVLDFLNVGYTDSSFVP